MAAAPIQRGRLFNTPDLLYGHLRDFRDEPDAATLQAGSLCVVASRTLVATGRRIPLLSVEEVRRRVPAPGRPGLLSVAKDYFAAAFGEWRAKIYAVQSDRSERDATTESQQGDVAETERSYILYFS
jgi:hypothetical protein